MENGFKANNAPSLFGTVTTLQSKKNYESRIKAMTEVELLAEFAWLYKVSASDADYKRYRVAREWIIRGLPKADLYKQC
jgi:hypothetical protein